MKERPILFNGAMVRAILSGQKTQTRRVVKGMALEWLQPGRFTPEYVADPDNGMCPYGKPGDQLWVRESTEADYDASDVVVLSSYCADKAPILYWTEYDGEPVEAVHHWSYPRDVRPSIHMPRWACRIVLEIVSVRVERLQDISRGDAMDEGCPFPNMADGDDPRQWFAGLWQTINGHESWQANPWVWVVEFKEVAA